MNKERLNKEIAAAVRADKYNVSPNGVISMFNDGLVIRGEYEEGVNGKDFRRHPNLITNEGIVHMLNVVLGSTSKNSNWYLAPFSGSAAVAATWTGANFTANATEITSPTEGYTESYRQACSFVNTSGSTLQIDNYAAKAAFTIITATTLSVTGLGLLSVNTKGGVTGVCLSATKFTTARTLQDGDTWNAGYRVVLASS